MSVNAADLHDRVARIVRAISITEAGSVRFAGHDLAAVPSQPDEPEDRARVQLQNLLYQHCYCREFDGRLGDFAMPATPSDGFVAMLSAANAGRSRWSAGWTIATLNPDSSATLRRGSLCLRAWPGEYVTHDGPSLPPRIGGRASIWIEKESLTLQPGFYFAFSESLDDGRDTSNLVRFYWAITEAGAATLVNLLTKRLCRFSIPFRFKCGSLPSGYERLDAAVLYIDKRFYEVTAAALADVYDAAAPTLRSSTPLFAKRLAPGLALAEDPGASQSFGMERCAIVAEGICHGAASGLFGEHELVESVREQFRRRGLSFEQPYLNAGSLDTYWFANRDGTEVA